MTEDTHLAWACVTAVIVMTLSVTTCTVLVDPNFQKVAPACDGVSRDATKANSGIDQ